MILKLYHGSNHVIEKPTFDFIGAKECNDYGKGFYCTENLALAKEWSVDKKSNGYANEYKINTDNLDILDLSSSKFTNLHWLGILLENRIFDMPSSNSAEAKSYILENFKVDYKNRDAIIGYRADDSYFTFASNFLSGVISYQQLSKAMYFGKLGKQFVLKSEKAFSLIEFQKYHYADKNVWFPKKQERDKNARNAYLNDERLKRKPDDLFIYQIIDKKLTADSDLLRTSLILNDLKSVNQNKQLGIER